MTLQQQFEERASGLGYNIRKSEYGDYIYKPTGKLWRWYQAGAHSVLEYSDPSFLKDKDECQYAGFNQKYEG